MSNISAMTYTYTPAGKFLGTDKVEISIAADDNNRPRCGNGGGYGNSKGSRKKVISINFIIQ
ncbi:MAG: hypothetical protein K2X48_07440 [Chitinophagaceae bacterium]|nr:hypothetical protein [Chitinophagaceae bacterium]